MLWHVVHRAQRAKSLYKVVVATSNQSTDDAIAKFCAEHAISCFRGSEADVLDRYYHAAKSFGAEAVVRITGDCPLIDPEIIDRVVREYECDGYDYVTNTHPCTYPDGLDTEVFSAAALARAWRDARRRSEREHVTPYLHKNPSLFRIENVTNNEDISHMRWTVDDHRDLEFVRALYSYLGGISPSMNDILYVLRQRPELMEINAGTGRNDGYLESLREDVTVDPGR